MPSAQKKYFGTKKLGSKDALCPVKPFE